MNIRQSVRIIFRNKTYSLLNIAGLAVGIACAGLILLWVEDELTFDNFPKSENLYYIYQNAKQDDGRISTGNTFSVLLADALKNESAGIKRVSRVKEDIRNWDNGGITISGNGAFVDSTFFSMFDVKFINGNKKSAFSAEHTVALSESLAAKLFGRDNPVGQILKMNGRDYQITCVYSNIRKNSLFKFDWMVPVDAFIQEMSVFLNPYQWGVQHMITLAELERNVNPAFVNEQIGGVISKKSEYFADTKLFLYPLKRMRLYGNFSDGIETKYGNIGNVRTFSLIAFIILLIACINFMNLATARSQKRALEVGVRKTFGGSWLKLVSQFMVESALITFLAMVLAVCLVFTALPAFNSLIEKQLVLDAGKFTHWAGLLGVGLLTCLLAGSYPAFYMSVFPAVDMLKRLKTRSGPELWFRKGMVVFQFVVSLVFIICTSFIYLQMQHARNRPLGMNIDQVLTMEATDGVKKNFEPLRNTLLSTGAVSDIALSEAVMLNIQSGWGGMNWPGKPENARSGFLVAMVSEGMISTLGLELLEGGRDFDSGMREYGYMIINETLAKIMGEEEGRVGGHLRQGNSAYAEIIGVVKDFVYNDVYGVHQEPLILWYNPARTNYLFVRLKAGDVQLALNKTGKVIKEFDPSHPFDYRFMDDRLNQLFYEEQFAGKLALLFAALAIFISCLGLFGLTAFSAEQRTREIGIRKVMGASTWSIIQLLGRNFLFLILISFVIAIPVAWWLVHEWLNSFDYRINESWTVFAGASLLVTFIAMFTVSAIAFKAAISNPVKAIKTE